ncbi:DUF805 domain-containing protein [Salegentibacter chungangensis]|uniref:DUF805 domain-containing protein n=1 Tax=Salegentibacter chungangensis TaxID=1335724 RepID=A0ABW3NU44_9FLAO
MKWYLHVLNNYSVFNGRARRMEYWMFIFYNFIFTLLAIAFDMIIAHYTGFFGTLFLVYTIASIIPSLAVASRRLHDTDNSGWMCLINLIPIIGGFWFLILTLTEGVAGSNKWGPDPKHKYF